MHLKNQHSVQKNIFKKQEDTLPKNCNCLRFLLNNSHCAHESRCTTTNKNFSFPRPTFTKQAKSCNRFHQQPYRRFLKSMAPSQLYHSLLTSLTTCFRNYSVCEMGYFSRLHKDWTMIGPPPRKWFLEKILNHKEFSWYKYRMFLFPWFTPNGKI